MSAMIMIPADLAQQRLGQALASGQQLEEFALNARRKAVAAPLPTAPVNGADDDAWLDVEYRAACRQAADPHISLVSVRAILAKLPGSLAEDIIANQ